METSGWDRASIPRGVRPWLDRRLADMVQKRDISIAKGASGICFRLQFVSCPQF
jgi:hypothetical protein